LNWLVHKLFQHTVGRLHSFYRPRRPLGRVDTLLYSVFRLEGWEGSASRPGRFLLPGKTQCPLYRRLGGPQCRSGQVRKISLSPGFDSRTVQPVTRRYIDWAIAALQHTLSTENTLKCSVRLNYCPVRWLRGFQNSDVPSMLVEASMLMLFKGFMQRLWTKAPFCGR
jgi:hypothetical protein